MTDKQKVKSYQVQAVLHLMISVDVQAKSLDDALELSKTMKEVDFVDIQGEYIDGDMRITGAYESTPEGL